MQPGAEGGYDLVQMILAAVKSQVNSVWQPEDAQFPGQKACAGSWLHLMLRYRS